MNHQSGFSLWCSLWIVGLRSCTLWWYVWQLQLWKAYLFCWSPDIGPSINNLVVSSHPRDACCRRVLQYEESFESFWPPLTSDNIWKQWLNSLAKLDVFTCSLLDCTSENSPGSHNGWQYIISAAVASDLLFKLYECLVTIKLMLPSSGYCNSVLLLWVDSKNACLVWIAAGWYVVFSMWVSPIRFLTTSCNIKLNCPFLVSQTPIFNGSFTIRDTTN